MKMRNLVWTLGIATALCAPLQMSLAKEKEGKMAGSDSAFIKKAANGGMMEVALGKVAAEKGGSKEVRDFGSRMVTDHSKLNDQLKEVAGKMSVEVPDKVNSKHQAMIDKMSGMSGAAFDGAYVKAMVKDHEKDIAEFEKASKMVKNEDLKKFIDDAIPVMKEHLEMIKKFDQAKS